MTTTTGNPGISTARAKAPATESQGPQATGGSRPSGVRGCPPGDAVPPWASTAKAAVLIEALP